MPHIRGQRVYEAPLDEATLGVSMLHHHGIDALLERAGDLSLIVVPPGYSPMAVATVIGDWAPRAVLVERH